MWKRAESRQAAAEDLWKDHPVSAGLNQSFMPRANGATTRVEWFRYLPARIPRIHTACRPQSRAICSCQDQMVGDGQARSDSLWRVLNL